MKTEYRYQIPYTTENEIEFIASLGITKYAHKEPSMLSRKELLERYLVALKMRVKWDNIDKEQVINYVQQALKNEKKR